jgi:hypothetical protein
MSTHHHFVLRPVARPNGEVEVLLCTDHGVEGVLPRPGEVRGTPVWLGDAADVPWSPAHMQVLFQFVGWGRRNVGVARPVDGAMWLTVVEDEAPGD